MENLPSECNDFVREFELPQDLPKVVISPKAGVIICAVLVKNFISFLNLVCTSRVVRPNYCVLCVRVG